MEQEIFTRMKVKTAGQGLVVNAPDTYPPHSFTVYGGEANGPYPFIHVFVRSREDFKAYVPAVSALLAGGGLFWISYPKGSAKTRPDINRDSLWDLVIPQGFHPVAQIALDETWSAVRLKPNEKGAAYVRPVRAPVPPARKR
ncbi:MAG: hypothetical protein LBC88_01950 [Spirochaetaceae bacterium]|jgi:hypothetical protein|nr:hypothetical protein [Spirochaetaceae bacterium]